MLLSGTTSPLDPAAWLIVALHDVLPGVLIVTLVQLNTLSCAPAVRLSVAVLLTPAYVAVSVALWALLITPVVAEKLTEVWPIATITLAGTVTSTLLLLIETIAATTAAFVKATVQVLVEPAHIVDGVQVSELNCGGAIRLSVVVSETLPPLAVTMAL